VEATALPASTVVSIVTKSTCRPFRLFRPFSFPRVERWERKLRKA
jgi:hypothetical protein